MPAADAAPSVSYVALGDSYSSGLGAGSYISSSGSCDRSTNAYPEQWAAANSPAEFASVACAGATTSDVISSQVSALSAATTLVSITIGGNDAGFSGVMETCVLKSTSSCLSAVTAAKSIVTSQLPARLTSTLQAIRQRAPSARIVLLGYPDLYDLSKSGTCIGLSTQDRTALNSGADALDTALQAAVTRAADPGIVYGGIAILQFEDTTDNDVVYIEGGESDSLSDESEKISLYWTIMNRLQEKALTTEDSAHLIAEVMKAINPRH